MQAVDRANYVLDKRHAYEDSPQCVSLTHPAIAGSLFCAVLYCTVKIDRSRRNHLCPTHGTYLSPPLSSKRPTTTFRTRTRTTNCKNSTHTQPSFSSLTCSTVPPRACSTSAPARATSQAYATTLSAAAHSNSNSNRAAELSSSASSTYRRSPRSQSRTSARTG